MVIVKAGFVCACREKGGELEREMRVPEPLTVVLQTCTTALEQYVGHLMGTFPFFFMGNHTKWDCKQTFVTSEVD